MSFFIIFLQKDYCSQKYRYIITIPTQMRVFHYCEND
jgi:hypothetical protein